MKCNLATDPYASAPHHKRLSAPALLFREPFQSEIARNLAQSFAHSRRLPLPVRRCVQTLTERWVRARTEESKNDRKRSTCATVEVVTPCTTDKESGSVSAFGGRETAVAGVGRMFNGYC